MHLDPNSFIFEFESLFSEENYLHFTEPILTDSVTENEVDFLINKLELTKGNHVSDFGCGHGRHSNKLAQRGFEVTGIDKTSHFLNTARKRARDLNVEVEYIQVDLRDMNFENKFDSGFMLFTAFGYFDDETNLRILKNIIKALKPNGKFCLDIINRDYILQNFMPSIVTEQGTDLLINNHDFDSVAGRIIVDRKYIRNNHIYPAPFSLRLYNFNEIKMTLEIAGFEVLDVFGNYNGENLKMSSKRLIVIASKNA